MPKNSLHCALNALLLDLRQRGMHREVTALVAAVERVAASPELQNANHITQVGRSELGLHGGQGTKFWESFGPVLGWFRPTSGPARGVPVPQLAPGESMTSFLRRSQAWLQEYGRVIGQGVVRDMQLYFQMMQQPGNAAALEQLNRQIYDKFSVLLKQAQDAALQKSRQRS